MKKYYNQILIMSGIVLGLAITVLGLLGVSPLVVALLGCIVSIMSILSFFATQKKDKEKQWMEEYKAACDRISYKATLSPWELTGYENREKSKL